MTAPTPLDVVHVTRATSAGVRRHVVDLIVGLAELGLRQGLVYAPNDADQAFWDALPRMEHLGVVARPVDMRREISPGADFRSGRAVLRELRDLRPRVVHLHSSKAGGVGRLAAVFLPGARIVYSPHASAANMSKAYAAIERVLGAVRTDLVVAVSASERAELAPLGYVPEDRLVRVDCGIDGGEVRAAAAAAPGVELPAGRLLVAAGRMNQQKDPQFLVRVAERLAPERPDLRVVWIGDGELRPAVERDVAAAGLQDRWITTGWLANPFPIIARATAFALPSRYESFGYVTLEAMALGRPVVATDITGSRDLVVPGATGHLVPQGDEAAFAAACARVLDDPGHAAALAAEATRRAEHFSRARMAREMRDVYRRLAG